MRGRFGAMLAWQRVVVGVLTAVVTIAVAPGLVLAIVWLGGGPERGAAIAVGALLVGLIAVTACGLNPLPRTKRVRLLVLAAFAAVVVLRVAGELDATPDVAAWFLVGFVVVALPVWLVPRGRRWSVGLAATAVVAGLIVLAVSQADEPATPATVVRIPIATPHPSAAPSPVAPRGGAAPPAVTIRPGWLRFRG